jgi:two-component system, chemotaxis family, protein-glutamate methylesterase/glutaminase
MKKIRVLIVDDAVVVRRLVADLLSADPALEVAGTAANGRIALAKVPQVKPDLVTLDLEMPDMDGLATLAALRETYPRLPVLMLSRHTQRASAATLDALAGGAALACPRPPSAAGLGARPRVDVLAIGASTGGPNALTALLATFPPGWPVPTLIVQHMPPVFTRHLAERLTTKSHLAVREAVAAAPVEPGGAWVALGDHHTELARSAAGVRVQLHQGPPENSCRPSVDVLFRSVADTYGPAALAVVLTGMGHDGLRGCEAIRAAGGQVLAQDEATSIVWGMPGSVALAGLAEQVLPLDELGPEIVRRVLAGRSRSLAVFRTAGA